MSCTEYLAALRAQGVRIRVEVVEGMERLKVDAPGGTLRDRMTAAIRQCKDEILQSGYWWTEGDGLTVWWGRCQRCGALVQGSGYGMRVPVGPVRCAGPCENEVSDDSR